MTIFQQKSAQATRAMVQTFTSNKTPKMLDWPAQSLDANIIENFGVWSNESFEIADLQT